MPVWGLRFKLLNNTGGQTALVPYLLTDENHI